MKINAILLTTIIALGFGLAASDEGALRGLTKFKNGGIFNKAVEEDSDVIIEMSDAAPLDLTIADGDAYANQLHACLVDRIGLVGLTGEEGILELEDFEMIISISGGSGRRLQALCSTGTYCFYSTCKRCKQQRRQLQSLEGATNQLKTCMKQYCKKEGSSNVACQRDVASLKIV